MGIAAYNNLQNLGEEKFRRITNQLLRGQPAMNLAREIQGKWGDLNGIAEKTLTQQLTRLKATLIKDGHLGPVQKLALEEAGELNLKLLRKSSIKVLEHLTPMAEIYERRIQLLWDREKELKMPMSGLNAVMKDYTDLLERIQKIQFDLGIDEYKGILGSVRTATHTVMNPDGSSDYRQVTEITNNIRDIMNKRGVYGRLEDGSDLEG
jgi:hypothetical protein